MSVSIFSPIKIVNYVIKIANALLCYKKWFFMDVSGMKKECFLEELLVLHKFFDMCNGLTSMTHARLSIIEHLYPRDIHDHGRFPCATMSGQLGIYLVCRGLDLCFCFPSKILFRKQNFHFSGRSFFFVLILPMTRRIVCRIVGVLSNTYVWVVNATEKPEAVGANSAMYPIFINKFLNFR